MRGRTKEGAMETILWAALAAVNLVGFVACVVDKRAAVRRKRRVRESTLFTLAAVGGAAGVFLAMLSVRHKTRKLKFMVGIPMIALAQAALIWVLLNAPVR